MKRRTEQLNVKNQELQLAYQKVEALSLTDRLTGLNNRLYLEQHVTNDLELSRRKYTDWQNGKAPKPENADIVTFMIDLDHFKHINDQHGHNAGDLRRITHNFCLL
ncbi:GGDEF domain-containing protein [Lacimicrobium alkaliphilum]|uniref:GGDEF domain-containing protein n=1 Tax=Lacimicrobium alkaliphilum TaxID=1526571 RepID=A0ABQ1QZX8_9ALTE|nr:GGDEF domain-containing protein [Lacimicrobium alkaliphilum]GGD52571.1 hypothetical protein GCM10011357_05520 [Lacimicrobium alkaliphilum]